MADLDPLSIDCQGLPVLLRTSAPEAAALLEPRRVERLARVKPTLELAGDEVSPDLLATARRLKGFGCGIAVDERALGPEAEALLELADLVRLPLAVLRERRAALEPLRASGRRLLVRELHTHEELRQAQELGGALFQGFYFFEPQLDQGAELPRFKANYLLFLSELAAEDIDFDRVEEIVKREQSLALRLLRYLNTPLFGVRNRVRSVRTALVHLGQEPLRRWGSLMAVSGLGGDRPGELVLTSMVRARFCELLAQAEMPSRSGAYFLTGLFSTVDALLNQPLERCLGQLTLEPEIRRAILGEFNPLGQALQLAIAFERADWTPLQARLEGGGSAVDLNALYLEALRWADEIFGLS